MSYFEHDDAIRSMIRRARVLKVDDSGTQQRLNLAGLKDERPEKIVRVLPHGFSSNPPAESEGVMVQLGGRSDRTMFLGGEHKEKRPKNLPAGGAVIYDADGNVVRVVGDDLQITHKKKIVLKVGNSSIEITDDGILLKGNVDLGDKGGLPVDRTDNNPSSKVKAI